jgi:hypothetical protein
LPEPSTRRLDEVGVEAVLGAMIEQKRRASQPSFPAIELPKEAEVEGAAVAENEADESTPESAPTKSAVFLKSR